MTRSEVRALDEAAVRHPLRQGRTVPLAPVELLTEAQIAPDRAALDLRRTAGPAADTRPAPLAAVADTVRPIVHRVRRSAMVRRTTPDPRRHSLVRRLVWEDADTVLARFDAASGFAGARWPRRLRLDGVAFRADPLHRDLRLRTRLEVPWTPWAYPVWLSVEPWWGARTVMGLELATHHRLHYSRRYFDAAHDALQELLGSIGAPIGPRGVRPPAPPPRSARPLPAQAPKGSGGSPTMLARSITRRSG